MGVVQPTSQGAGPPRVLSNAPVGVMARDILGAADVATVGRDITIIAEAALEVALEAVRPRAPQATAPPVTWCCRACAISRTGVKRSTISAWLLTPVRCL